MSLQIEEETPSEFKSEIMDANLFSVIRNRRATRSYLAKAVSEDLVRSLIDFSIQAPSAMNLQPWSFVVVQNARRLKEISEEVKKILFRNPDVLNEIERHGAPFINEPEFDIFYGATTLIVICAKKATEKEFSSESDCFLAGENLMLAASGMGLATCPVGLATAYLAKPEISKKFGIPSGYTPVLPIIVGYASGESPHVGRNPPIVNWIH